MTTIITLQNGNAKPVRLDALTLEFPPVTKNRRGQIIQGLNDPHWGKPAKLEVSGIRSARILARLAESKAMRLFTVWAVGPRGGKKRLVSAKCYVSNTQMSIAAADDTIYCTAEITFV